MGKNTQTAGSIVVMSIIGGTVIPLVMGIISALNGGNRQIAFIAPLPSPAKTVACFALALVINLNEPFNKGVFQAIRERFDEECRFSKNSLGGMCRP